MSRLGVADDVAELSIGHIRTGLAAAYNRDDAWAARVAAFEAVAAHIAGVVAGKEDRVALLR